MSANAKKKMSMSALILMIFTSVYGFNNMPRAFYIMGYGSIPFYIISALLFFIPFAFMIAEYGAAFKDEKGGIFSWMEICMGTKYAFIGTFMWYASYVVWLINISSGIMIPVSNAIFGTDKTGTWSLFGLSSIQTLGVIGVVFISVVTFFASKGISAVQKVAKIGGIACMAINVLLYVGAIAVLIGNGLHLLQPLPSTMKELFSAQHPAYQGTIGMFAFLVFALFAYGGTEAVGGLVDETENPEKNFGKGLTIAAIIVAIGYSLGIFCVGIFTNWTEVLGDAETVTLGNASYVIMNNLGVQIGKAFGASAGTCAALGNGVARFMGLSIVCSLSGALFTLIYSPLKQMIEGAPEGLLPKKFATITDGVPKNAMYMQCAFVAIMDLLIAFGGDTAAKFFQILTNMTNVAMTLPYMFIAGAFINFKKNDSIQKPFLIYKSKGMAVAFTWLILIVIGFANVFTIIQPAVGGDIATTVWSVLGPVIFSVVAWILATRYEKNKA